ncbi:DUF4011 domain-containing protein [Actinoplanes sp. NPDC051851]|uniref:DUF4011 domain-containing protein n=1 Tax=Actinoplanes sp. NPDC051851 TaxID=3154753 RepID=UPI00341A42A3
MGLADVRVALRAWRESLIDLGDTNRLINFSTGHPDLVTITAPEPGALVTALRTGQDLTIAGRGADPTPPAGALRTETADGPLGSLLRRLQRRSRQEYLDRGVHVLHLACGLLRWTDEEETEYASPILLVPVELVPAGLGEHPRLRLRDDDPVVNPALVLRLRAAGIPAPALDPHDPDVVRLWNDFGENVARRRGWRVERPILLGCLTFHKEAIYRDLLENEERIAAHPVVQALATTDHRQQSGEFRFHPVPAERVDRVAPPEDVPLVLDADSSQRACVAAALEGRSFVMDGPPGTGKSQTVANMIGCLLHAGRRVLFVSEKAAALDVVRNRLAESGLDRYTLELHGNHLGRKEVATALAAAADERPEPFPSGAPVDRLELREHREGLNAYAYAMNELRDPLGQSLHDVLGRCAALDAVPDAPVPALAPDTLTADALRRIREAADQLARAWRSAAGGDELPWRDVTAREPLDPVLCRAEKALAALAREARPADPLAVAFDLRRPGDAATLARLAEHAARRPERVRDDWLTLPDLEPVRRAAEELGRELAAAAKAGAAVKQRAGVEWSELPEPDGLPSVPDLGDVVPEPLDLDPLTAADADQLARTFTRAAEEMDRHRRAVDRVTTGLGLPAAVTFSDVARVAAVVELGTRQHKPEQFWFSPSVLSSVSAGAQTLKRTLEQLVSAEIQARPYFSEAFLAQPVEELADRFHRVHRGWRKLSAAYRRDRRTVSGFVLPQAHLGDAISRLDAAVAWKAARQELAAAEHAYGPVLGRYWQGRGTDFGALDEALQTASQALASAPARARDAITAYVCAKSPDPEPVRVVAEARDALLRWQATLRPAPHPSPRPELANGPVAAAVAWLRAHVTALHAVTDRVRAFDTATTRTLDLAETGRLAGLRATAAEAAAALDLARHSGPLADGDGDEAAALPAAVAWAAEARRLGGGEAGGDAALAAEQVAALRQARPRPGLAARAEEWATARQAVLDGFALARHAELVHQLDDYARARNFLKRIRDDASGQEEWFACLDARDVLTRFGLDAAVETCADRRTPGEEVPPVVERAVLRAWVDAVVRSDARLRPWRSADRDRLAADFRAADERLASAAAREIAAEVVARRPRGDTPAAALLRREAMKADRHLPVRELIGQARDLVLTLRPCVLASPLTVSQALPADLRFDVVIFDEASQVTPADAVNCVYRADSMITAGDDRQLPPTSFFDRVTRAVEEPEDPETDVLDFPSVLELAKACGGFPTMSLTWHYRSRHEALIAFANQAFYQGRLSTFPSPGGGGPDTGIELIPVAGVYRRSTTRDNPAEAERVAERVLHHFDTRPDRTLGVVTFSVAQAEAIENALERRAGHLPALDDDRLHGLFVKSLESVQGDERDVMIFSIGYGYDDTGRISTNFGALNRPNGWRRLNVAITRARHRVEIVTSILARDIPESDNEGVRQLAAYLDHAERGAISEGAESATTPFAASIARLITSWGYPVRTGLGTSGGRVDLAVCHPGDPAGAYLLGVRCDGPAYRACPAARDRDRLTGQVLAGLGWRLHRVWSLAWYRDTEGEQRRLREAIERAAERHPLRTGPVEGPGRAAGVQARAGSLALGG